MCDSSSSTIKAWMKTTGAGYSFRFANVSPMPLSSISPAAKATATKDWLEGTVPTTTLRNHSHQSDSLGCWNHFCERNRSKDSRRILAEEESPFTERIRLKDDDKC